tara:strand:+ start:3362 stop:3610 length:249 start_codon:yes stop_codon:yes gene_type:complete
LGGGRTFLSEFFFARSEKSSISAYAKEVVREVSASDFSVINQNCFNHPHIMQQTQRTEKNASTGNDLDRLRIVPSHFPPHGA